MATESLLVVSTLDRLEVGREFRKIPSHMTILPWFELAADRWAEFQTEVEATVEETAMPVAIGGDEILYGQHHDTSVRLLNRPTSSFNLINGFDVHARIYRAAEQFGGNFDETYTGIDWSPHITATPERIVEEDETIVFDNITIFAKQALGNSKTVKAIHYWSNIYE